MSVSRQQPVITSAVARELVDRAIAEGESLGVAVSVTIVDPSMSLIAFGRADGATPHSVQSSRAKANTAASIRRETGGMGEDLAIPLALATNLQLTNILGGTPLRYDGEVIGAVGVAGGTPAQDAEVAQNTAAGIPEA
jgi:glc operon protein GlcG